MTELTAAQWDAFIHDHPEAHILQSPTWGRLKAEFGWTPKYVRQGDLGAMVMFRRLPLGFSVAYIPRGPVGEGDWAAFWPEVDELCRTEKAVFLRVEPEVWEPAAADFADRKLPGFQPTEQTVQPPRTVLVDLTAPEDDLLMAMKSKTRYNIRLAERKDVAVQPSSDVAAFHRMMKTTGERDAFGIHSLAYYRRAYELFSAEEACTLLIASYEDQPLAGLMAFAWGDTAWYFYGASTNRERNRMPTYLLQWEAMRWAKSKGCKTYDLWGVPDHPEDELEDQFTDRSEGLWGVYRFKRGFGGEVRRTVGAWDRVYRPALYRLYELYASRNRTPSA
jgi:lipid II:glycine glycyltransferase (peptidoglycan interpeptide bridge formation enzyme)